MGGRELAAGEDEGIQATACININLGWRVPHANNSFRKCSWSAAHRPPALPELDAEDNMPKYICNSAYQFARFALASHPGRAVSLAFFAWAQIVPTLPGSIANCRIIRSVIFALLISKTAGIPNMAIAPARSGISTQPPVKLLDR